MASPYDVDSNTFEADAYLDKMLKDCNLKQIMDKESEVIRESQYLQSEMQTLVYENYNKFISATDTVRKMRKDFRTMQSEMEQLSENMEKITQYSSNISASLNDSGAAVSRLCGTRQLLDRLQFLFLLPSQLNAAINESRFSDAVSEYVHAQKVLERYGSQPSFQGIQAECEDIVNRLKFILKDRLTCPDMTAAELAESACLLVRLHASEESLNETFLSCSGIRLDQHLDALKDPSLFSDLLEWVEKSNNGFLADIGIVVSSYNEMFLQSEGNKTALALLTEFTDVYIDKYIDLVKNYQICGPYSGTEILVRGLDKFHRRLQAMAEHMPGDDLGRKATDVVVESIINRSKGHIESIKGQLRERLTVARQTLAGKGGDVGDLNEILTTLQVFIMEKVQAALHDLIVFLQKGLSFSLKSLCISAVASACMVLIEDTMSHIVNTVKGFSTTQISTNNIPTELLLILAKLCLELQNNGVRALQMKAITLLENTSPGSELAVVDTVETRAILGSAAQVALDAHVARVGQSAAQMLRVSVLARDWLRAPEPKVPRAVCRHVVEALEKADAAAAQLFPAGTRQSSDSSRRTLRHRPTPASLVPLGRLFAERIEVFGPAGADRAALSAGALKVALKALVECVRLRTFGKHGLQQLQVDTHFLQQRLSCAGSDERLLSALLDDALASAQLRCVDPQLMVPSIVDIICEGT